MTFFEPSPVLLAFIFVQRFVFFEVLAVLALLRLCVGHGSARIPAAATLLICLAAVLTTFAPALNFQDHALYRHAARAMAIGGGMMLPLIASAVFATSLAMASRRWRWIDVAHLVGLGAFIGLWYATRV